MKDIDRAWLAGLYEGEGCCAKAGTCSYQIYIKMTDEDIIRRVHALFDSGSVYVIPTDGVRKEAYKWIIGHRKDVERFIYLTSEFLGKRRNEKFLEVTKHYEKRDAKNMENS